MENKEVVNETGNQEEDSNRDEVVVEASPLDRLLDRSVPVVGENGEVAPKSIREIITLKEVYLTNDGNYVMTHTAIQKLAQAVGAYWEKVPHVVETPNENNFYGYSMFCVCYFPDGSYHTETGEASDANTKSGKNGISNDYKFTMAHKRGNDRSFLRSNYIGLFDVYSSEESDSFSRENQEVKNMKKEIEQLQKENAFLRRKAAEGPRLNELIPYVALPEEDEKYPGVPLLQLWSKYRDKEYIEHLMSCEWSPIQWIAKGMNAKIEKTLLEEKEKEEKIAAAETEEAV